MQPQRATLVDLLDRLLDRGVILDADVLICVAEVPLLAISLRAALAGVQTMLKYGLMQEWIEAQQARAALVSAIDVKNGELLPLLKP